jgi:hypothetical protein
MSDWFARSAFAGGDFLARCPGGVAPAGSPAGLAEACANASATGVQQALMAAVCVFFLAAAAYFMASRTLREDFFSSAAVGEVAAQPAK